MPWYAVRVAVSYWQTIQVPGDDEDAASASAEAVAMTLAGLDAEARGIEVEALEAVEYPRGPECD